MSDYRGTHFKGPLTIAGVEAIDPSGVVVAPISSTLLGQGLVSESDGSISHGVEIYNNSVGTLAAGTLVYLSSYTGTSGIVVVKADADANIPATHVVKDAILASASGFVYERALVTAQNTNGRTIGDAIYLDATTAGGWTASAPTGADQVVQQVGTVKVVSATVGQIEFWPSTADVKKVGSSYFQTGSVLAGAVGFTIATHGAGTSGSTGATVTMGGNTAADGTGATGSSTASITMGGNTASDSASITMGGDTASSTASITMGGDTASGVAPITVGGNADSSTASITMGGDTASGGAVASASSTASITMGGDTASGTASITMGGNTAADGTGATGSGTASITMGGSTASDGAVATASSTASITMGGDTASAGANFTQQVSDYIPLAWGKDIDAVWTNGGGLVGASAKLTNALAGYAKVSDYNGGSPQVANLSASAGVGGGGVYTANYQLFPDTEEANDYVAFGGDNQFAEIGLDMSATVGVYAGDSCLWEYSQGSGVWATLGGVFDNTDAVAQNGLRPFGRGGAVCFNPPADWAKDTIGVTFAFWIRSRVTATNITTAGLTNSVEHDIVTSEDAFQPPISGNIISVTLIDSAATLHAANPIKVVMLDETTGTSRLITWGINKRRHIEDITDMAVTASSKISWYVVQEDGTNEPSNVMVMMNLDGSTAGHTHGATGLTATDAGHTHTGGAHTHGATGLTATDAGHTHTGPSHTHAATGLTATDAGHTHSATGLTATDAGHTHTGGAHTHGATGLTATDAGHTHNLTSATATDAGHTHAATGLTATDAGHTHGATGLTATDSGHTHASTGLTATDAGHTHTGPSHTHASTGLTATDSGHTHSTPSLAHSVS